VPYTASNHPHLPGAALLDAEQLPHADDTGAAKGEVNSDASVLPGHQTNEDSCCILGSMYCLNTPEALHAFDRASAVQQAARAIWDSVLDGSALQTPSKVQRMLMLAYCDLKHYKYHHWFAFPVLQPPEPYTLIAGATVVAEQRFDAATIAAISAVLHASGLPSPSTSPAQLLVVDQASSSPIQGQSCTCMARLYPLTAWPTLIAIAHDRAADGDVSTSNAAEVAPYLVFIDPSNSSEHPGWALRNLLLLAAVSWKISTLHVLCVRTRKGRFDPSMSLVLTVKLPHIPLNFVPQPLGGWAVDPDHGRPAPRIANLASSMDDRVLANSAVYLNLNLMKWRAAPDVDIASISNTRCLLLGAGTLGCSVARTLVGWGVRKITFVDNARVSFSNPVRQSLYVFEDCRHGGRPKATAAAEALQKIFPDVDAQGVELTIPMPGHPPASEKESQRMREESAELDRLIRDHDVCFLLLDTRESRWAPTLLCAAHGKLAITAALGFDSFMVMRHGQGVPDVVEVSNDGVESMETEQPVGTSENVGPEFEVDSEKGEQPASGRVEKPSGEKAEATRDAPKGESGTLPEGGQTSSQEVPSRASPSKRPSANATPLHTRRRLGCYFCNDIVAPANSTRDRTLDQQCTVARPGLSSIAGSLAVELLSAVVQHPAGIAAPAAGSPQAAAEMESAHAEGRRMPPLGDVPHMIRGQLGGFSQFCLHGEAFEQCPGCSAVVVNEYRVRGLDFVLRVASQSGFLEEVSGLAELRRASERLFEDEGRLEEGFDPGYEGAMDMGSGHAGEHDEPSERVDGGYGKKHGDEMRVSEVRDDHDHDDDWEEI
jgi:ubiquitin-like modifier-activating enzyme ATG7